MQPIDAAIQIMKNNSFSKPFYTVDLPMDDVLPSLLRFLDRRLAKQLEAEGVTDLTHHIDGIYSRIPSFQRENDKWTPSMQSLFVRNVLMGAKPQPVILYSLDDTKSHCKLLDGLQRSTAIARFFTDPDMPIPFADNVVLTAKELLESETVQRILWNLTLPIRIYTFNSDAEACRHYIEINENMTHSNDDILRAKQFLKANS